MKKIRIYHRMLVLGLLLMATWAQAEEPAMRFVDAAELRIINKGWENTFETYTRLPLSMKDSIRPDLWARCLNSAGIAVRFRTNATRIAARYNLHTNFHMAHMADTGIKGTDLYILDEDGIHWHYVNTCRPTKDSIQHKVYVEHMDSTWKECMIYLPLYDGVNWLEVGVDSTAEILLPEVNNPVREKKVVCYGTSILHGGCASRTGMCPTSIMQRELNMEFVNLGTSGEGKMVYAMARAMAKIENVAAYVIDPVPNCTKDMCDTLTYNFVRILRDAHPDVPIIMVEGLIYPYARYDSFFREYLPQKNVLFRKGYEQLLAERPEGLYYITSAGLTARWEEGTVDGIHSTDLGFRAYADIVEAVLREALKLENNY